MVHMRSVFATRRQFLTAGGVALAGAVLSGTAASAMIRSPSVTPSPLAGEGRGGGSSTATATATATPAPTPATVTIPVPVYQQSMVLDCETAALQQGLGYYGIFVSQPTLFALENADTRVPLMGANHTVLRWGNPYTNFVGYVNGSDWAPTGFGVYWPVILELAHRYGLPNAIGGEGFAPSRIYSELAAGHPVQVWIQTRFARVPLGTWTAWGGTPG